MSDEVKDEVVERPMTEKEKWAKYVEEANAKRPGLYPSIRYNYVAYLRDEKGRFFGFIDDLPPCRNPAEAARWAVPYFDARVGQRPIARGLRATVTVIDQHDFEETHFSVLGDLDPLYAEVEVEAPPASQALFRNQWPPRRPAILEIKYEPVEEGKDAEEQEREHAS